MTLVAVYPTGIKTLGAHRPGVRGLTWDWRARARSAKNTAGVRADHTMELVAACAREWPTPAMMTAGVLADATTGRPAAAQPRLTKDVLPWLAEQGWRVQFAMLMADVDNQPHVAWTPETSEAFERTRRSAGLLATAGLYFTPRGCRVVQPLAAPLLSPEAYLETLLPWLDALDAQGLVTDPKCRAWMHLMAVPTYRAQDGALVGGNFSVGVGFADMVAVPAADLPKYRRYAARPASAAAGAAADAPPIDVAFAADVPAAWRPRVVTIATAVRDVATTWHDLFLALAGALCERGVDVALVPAITHAVSVATGADTRSDDRMDAARTTVARWAMRGQPGAPPIVGGDALLLRWPGVAAALAAACAPEPPQFAKMRAMQDPPDPNAPPLPTGAEARDALVADIALAPRGVTVVVAACGLGKTAATRAVAAERARTQYATTVNVPTDAAAAEIAEVRRRAPPNSKTAVSAPTNRLATQIARDLTGSGTPARRIFSPLSMWRSETDHTPECRHVEGARALAAGGQSVRREFCDGRELTPCEWRGVCRAYAGTTGDPDARVLVGSHALLAELAAFAGPTGKLVIDEPPALLVNTSIGKLDLYDVEMQSSAFSTRYTTVLRPVVAALAAVLEMPVGAEDAPSVDFAVAVRWVAGALDPAAVRAACDAATVEPTPEGDLAADALAAAARALPLDARGDAPPILASHAVRARGQFDYARKVGNASRVLLAIYRAAVAATSSTRHTVHLERRNGVTRLVLTGPATRFVDALRRDGATVVLDATPDIPVLSRAAGVNLEAAGRVRRHYARDGAPVERTIIAWSSGTRNKLHERGGVAVATLAAGVRAAVAWALERPEERALAFVSFKRVALAVQHALAAPGDERFAALWVAGEWSRENLDDAAAALRPILAEYTDGGRRTVATGWYGALRGMDDMAEADAIVTLGDPWPALVESREASAYLGLPDWNVRYLAMTRAELEQAHGRLRTIWRTRKGRGLHIGHVVPSGPGWQTNVEFRCLRGGRPKGDSAVSPSDLHAWITASGMSLRAAAKRLRVDLRTLRRWLSGEAPIPPSAAAIFTPSGDGDGGTSAGEAETPLIFNLYGRGAAPPETDLWDSQWEAQTHQAEGGREDGFWLPPDERDPAG